MMSVIIEYLPTTIILLILIGIVAAVITGMVKDKKAGKSCGCSGCSSCPMAGSCKKEKCG